MGERVYFTLRGFLRAMGRHDGKSDCEWLKRCFSRLVACAVKLKYGGRTYEDNLMGWGEDKATDQMLGIFAQTAEPVYSAD